MRILRGLSSRVLPCGCIAGVYETYDGEVVNILDARGQSCAATDHQPGHALPADAVDGLVNVQGRPPGHRVPPA